MSEDVGTFQVFYSVVFPTNTTIINSFFMRVATVMGTAGEKFTLYVHAANYYKHYALVYNTFMYTDEDDYQRIRGSQQERFFSNTMSRASAEVTIRTDDKYEGVEEFSLDLFFAQQLSGFFVKPNNANVTIIETTSEYIPCPISE